MGKPLCHLSQVRVEPLISTFVFPGRRNLGGCITEDGDEPILYPDSFGKSSFDCIDASL
jgi:hypothetical protein